MATIDVLVVGSGIAGLTVAIKAAQQFPERKVVILTKDAADESNTRYAQGGIAVVSDKIKDSFERHEEDTCEAGDGLCDAAIVSKVVREAPARLNELIGMGVEFDRDQTGDFCLSREGGHQAHRVIHWQDSTGLQLSKALLVKVKQLPNIELIQYRLALDLITFAHACYLDIGELFEKNYSSQQFAESMLEYPTEEPDLSLHEIKLSLQNLMTKYVGIVRNNKGLRYAYDQIRILEERMTVGGKDYLHSQSWCELRNMICCAKLIVEHSRQRKVNRGVFFNRDIGR